MPANLHALIRYRTIDQCLRRPGKKWSRDKLAQACGDALRYFVNEDIDDPSIRTIQDDIDSMRDGKLGYYAPIVYSRARQSYIYTDPDFSISNSPLTVEDASELNHALAILRQFSGFRHVEGIESIITKLEYTLSLRGSRAKEAIQFDHSIDAPGQKWLDALYRAIQNESALKLTYKPFTFSEPFVALISPCLLKEYNKRWFCIALNNESRAISTFALDRILDIQPGEGPYLKGPGFDPDSYFRDIVGVSIPEDGIVEDILLKFTAQQAKYIHTKPLHPSQQVVEETAEHTTFAFRLMQNYELESLILSFGERVEVLRPEGLREKVKQRAGEMYSLYKNSSGGNV